MVVELEENERFFNDLFRRYDKLDEIVYNLCKNNYYSNPEKIISAINKLTSLFLKKALKLIGKDRLEDEDIDSYVYRILSQNFDLEKSLCFGCNNEYLTFFYQPDFSVFEYDPAEPFFVPNPLGIRVIKFTVRFDGKKIALNNLVIETIDKKSHLFFWDNWTDKGHPTVVYGSCFTDDELLEQQALLSQKM